MDRRLHCEDDIKLLYHHFFVQPVNDKDLFEKARVFNSFRVNLGLDFTILDDIRVDCSELFVNILMRDLFANSDLQEDSEDCKLIRSFLLNVLKKRKSGVIWRFVSSDIRVRYEFLMILDTRRCPSVRKYFEQLSGLYLIDAFK